MHVESAYMGQDCLRLKIDGVDVFVGDKYTILEMAYAVLLAIDASSHSWLTEMSETIPADPEDGRNELTGCDGMTITSDAVVVALSYQDWWARNSENFIPGPLRIPSRDEAVEIARSRQILNEFNLKYLGKLGGEWAGPTRQINHFQGTSKTMDNMFRMRFQIINVDHWASRYNADDPREVHLEGSIAASAKKLGYLTKHDLFEICRWKSPRTSGRCDRNDEDFVRAVTATAFSTPNERLRIEVLTLLDGVDWPTASVILHFCSPDRYPILDFRALWSLQVNVHTPYSFEFWKAYTLFCRQLADQNEGLTMRNLDRALWQYSKEKQPVSSIKS
ncbi:MAG TPA: hypothetical protein VIM11_16750 [Tepidisphaeraceae bacterium]|jgi:hypothetical protein